MMTQTSISYAVVLYELKISREAVSETRQILEDVPQVQKALEDPTIPKETKHRLIGRIFPGEMQNFLKNMCDHQQAANAQEIFRAYREYADRQEKILNATLCYVTLPKEEQMEKIRQFLKKKYQCGKVNLELTECPELIGGFILKVGSSEYDWSLQGRLRQMTQKIIRR